MRAWISTFLGKSLRSENNSKRKRELVKKRNHCTNNWSPGPPQLTRVRHTHSRNRMARMHLPEGGEGLFEFTGIKFLVSVEVHAVEDDPEGADSDTTLLLDS